MSQSVTKIFTLRGFPTDPLTPDSPSFFKDLGVESQNEWLSPAANRDSGQLLTADVAADDVITLDYKNGMRLCLSGEEFLEEFHVPQESRDVAGNSAIVIPDTLRPRQLHQYEAEQGQRGFLSDLKDWALDKIGISRIKGKVFQEVGEIAGRKICRAFEDRVLSVKAFGTPNLRHCPLNTDRPDLSQKADSSTFSGSDPILVLIHGTASCTEVAFRELWDHPSSNETSHRQKLFQTYGDRVVAFQHRTLTESPIENTIELAKSLPDGAVLHLVTHSRGGQIGELLCRAERVALKSAGTSDSTTDKLEDWDSATPFTEDEFRYVAQEDAAEAARLKELGTILSQKKFRVERFVRAACPARGTTLVSGKLDRWLSVVMSLLNRATQAVGGVLVSKSVELLTELAQSIVKSRTDPATLPGLEGMMPGSHTVRLVSNSKAVVRSDLSVVAGQLRGQSFVSVLTTLVSDLFYGGPNDGVVNTGSMYSGARRLSKSDTGAVLTQGVGFIDSIASVGHSSYFGDDRTGDAVVHRLTSTNLSQSTFAPISDAQITEPDRGVAVRFLSDDGSLNSSARLPYIDGRRPIVVMLPGIMGSNLSANGERIWADVGELMWGGMDKLQPQSPGVAAESIFNASYGRLDAFLQRSHDVLPFEYDWRRSVTAAADRLAETMNALLSKTEPFGQPIRILAHSMGGLVARALMLQHPDVWRRICERPNSHTVMLGTPLYGSFRVLDVLTGNDSMVSYLSTLDLWNSEAEILRIVAKYTGLMELLPRTEIQLERLGCVTKRNYFNSDEWSQLAEIAGRRSLTVPDRNALRVARQTARLADGDWDTSKVIYVHGTGESTPSGYEMTGGRLKSVTTHEGDGTVLWELGDLPLRRFWMDAVHGNMADHEPAFGAIRQLLESGRLAGFNSSVSNGPAFSRSTTGRSIQEAAEASVVASRMPKELPMLPTNRQLTMAALGATSAAREPAKQEQPVRVSVVHGDLAFSRHPVVVGHYYGDPIVGAERQLDETLDGRLADRQVLGLYPGNLNTNLIALAQDDNPQTTGLPENQSGALVVGLGEAGQLTPARLEQTMTRAFLNLGCSESDKVSAADGLRELRISSLLVGTGADSLTCKQSVTSILRAALEANRRLAKGVADTRIGEIEFIELYDTKALTALNDLIDQTEISEFANSIELLRRVKQRDGGLHSLRPASAPGWWHRMTIQQDRSGNLRFTALTQRSVAPEFVLKQQRKVIDMLVKKVNASTRFDDNFTSVANALFHQIVPRALKERASQSTGLLLVVDEHAAAIPWEAMLDRRNSNEEPISVAAGLVRQLSTRHFRGDPRDATQRNALVVGDPVSDFPELPGAQAEAQSVQKQLASMGVEVTSVVRGCAPEIICAMSDRSYRIWHLAGHGVHEFNLKAWREKYPLQATCTDDNSVNSNEFHLPVQPNCVCDDAPPERGVSGMVLGSDIFLDPPMVENIANPIPELVFINCCHLGKTISDGDSVLPLRTQYHEFAANIAVQFMQIGVRAVVAAGWAVNDSAAKTFADTFYDRILSGSDFGDSVRDARRETYLQHPDSNTWAAFQCYGDPGWRLSTNQNRHSSSESGFQPRAPLSELEFVAEVRNIRLQASVTANQRRPRRLRKRLNELIEFLDSDWQQSGSIATSLGMAWSELADMTTGLDYLEKSLTLADGNLTANALNRWIECRYRTATMSGKSSELRSCRNDLNRIVDVTPSAVRFAMLGSIARREALLSKDLAAVRKHLTASRKYYRDGVEHQRKRDQEREKTDNAANPLTFHLQNTMYSMFNYFISLSLESLVTSGRDPVDGLDCSAVDHWCQTGLFDAREMDLQSPQFWSAVRQGELRLARLLLQFVESGPQIQTADQPEAKLPGAAELASESIEGYVTAMRRGCSPRDRLSVHESIAGIRQIVEKWGQSGGETDLDVLKDQLTRIETAVRAEM